jgi:hypothetical protein
MSSPTVERRLRSYLEERAAEPFPVGMEHRIVRRSQMRGDPAPHRSWLSQAASAAAIAVLAIGIGVGIVYARTHATPATHPPTVKTSASPTPAPPTGGPAPAELRGQWLPPDGSGRIFIMANSWTSGDAYGEFVVRGDEIDFYNGKYCGIRLPGGVGRYRWSVSDGLLRFTPLDADPCSDRPTMFAGPFTKIAGSR